MPRILAKLPGRISICASCKAVGIKAGAICLLPVNPGKGFIRRLQEHPPHDLIAEVALDFLSSNDGILHGIARQPTPMDSFEAPISSRMITASMGWVMCSMLRMAQAAKGIAKISV